MLFSLLIGLFFFFLYIHLQNQYKKSQALEIYEMDYTTNKELNEILSLKQPLLFSASAFSLSPPSFLRLLDENRALDVSVLHDPIKGGGGGGVGGVGGVGAPTPIPFAFSSAQQLFETKPNFLSINNDAFLKESHLLETKTGKPFLAMERLIEPPMKQIQKITRDIIFGSNNIHTPMTYHTNTSLFLYIVSPTTTVSVPEESNPDKVYPPRDEENNADIPHITKTIGGSVNIKLTYWDNRKYLLGGGANGAGGVRGGGGGGEISYMDVWRTSGADSGGIGANSDYPEHTNATCGVGGDLNKIKFMDIKVLNDHIISIPPYWWYSLEIPRNSYVYSVKYESPMNMLANVPFLLKEKYAEWFGGGGGGGGGSDDVDDIENTLATADTRTDDTTQLMFPTTEITQMDKNATATTTTAPTVEIIGPPPIL